MNDDPILISGSEPYNDIPGADPIFVHNNIGFYRGRSDLDCLIAMAINRGLHLIIVREKQPSTEEVAAKLVQEFKLSTDLKASAEPFFPKESAWERRNPNAP